ncbi:MAG: class I tRNA ligase family protein, partial [Patescibacteria group bacterium]
TLLSRSSSKFVDEDPNSDYNYFYPTSVMETGYDILPWWVCRMVMLGLYMTGEVPFRTVYLHGLVRDARGQKMSKSKGNVINPIDMADRYGADALRLALVFGNAPGRDQALSEDKIRGMRNFANKIWNIGRFINLVCEGKDIKYVGPLMSNISTKTHSKMLVWCYTLIDDSNKLIKKVTQDMERYRFNGAAEKIYEYAWHELADKILEIAKTNLKQETKDAPYIRGTLIDLFSRVLLLLHPFMPFITEELWSKIPRKYTDPLIISRWPTS